MSQSQLFAIQNKSGQRIFYSIVQKQSQRKLLFHQRLLVLVDQKYLGYISQFNRKQLQNGVDVDKIKKKIPLKDIRKIMNKNKQITIMINQYDKCNQLKSLKWLFRMSNEQLAQRWTEVLERQNSPFPSRKTTQQRQGQFQIIINGKKRSSKKMNMDSGRNGSRNKSDQKKVDELMVPEQSDEEGRRKGSYSFGTSNLSIEQGLKSPPRESKRQVINSEISLGVGESFKKKTKKPAKVQQLQLLQNLTNEQKQILQINYINYYREKYKQIDDKKYTNFYRYCELKARQLLIQNLTKENTIKNWLQQIDKKNGIKVSLLQTNKRQKNEKDEKINKQNIKTYETHQKIMNWLWHLISTDLTLSQVFKIMMSCIVQYKGLIIYFICDYQVDNQNQCQVNQDYFQYLDKFSKVTKINQNVLGNQDCIKFVPISKKCILISQIGDLFPKLISVNAMMRPEMFMQIYQQFPKIQYSYIAKTSRKEQQYQNRYFKQTIQQILAVVSKNLDRLQQYVIHPSEFSHLIHSYGLNIAHICQIEKRVSSTFVKRILKTEAVVRSFKAIYRKRMQEYYKTTKQFNGENGSYTQKQQQQSIKQTKQLINTLLSEQVYLWQSVSKHCQSNFKMLVKKQEINKGYLFLGLQFHLGLKMDTKCRGCQKIFSVDDFIDEIKFIRKIKPCQLFWIDQNSLQGSKEVVDSLFNKLQLKQKQIPFYIKQDRYILQKIYDVISLYYAPQNQQIKHLKIYQQQQQQSINLTLFNCRRIVSQIKWLIKFQEQINNYIDIDKIEKKLEKLKKIMFFYFGLYHPFYGQIYDMIISLYQKQNNYLKILEYLQMSMTNIIQLCGGNTMHIRIANNHYQKGEFYQNWGKCQFAIDSYKKAKYILQFNSYTKQRQYAMIQLKLGMLFLSKCKDSDAYKLLMSCLVTFSTLTRIPLEKARKYMPLTQNHSYSSDGNEISEGEQLQNYTYIVTSLEHLNRCAVTDPNRISLIIEMVNIIIANCVAPEYPMNAIGIPDDLTIKLIKLLVQNYFQLNRRQISQHFISYIQSLCDQIHVVNCRLVDPIIYLNVIKQMVIKNMLIETLANFKLKTQSCLLTMKISNLLLNQSSTNRSIQNFHQLMKAILVILGQGFILGVLMDKKY